MHALGGLYAVFTEQAVMHVLIIWVQMVYDHICVARVTGSENNHLEFFRQILKDVYGMGSDVNSGLDYLPVGEHYWQFYIIGVV